jgi:hypothetical protein
MVICIKCGKEQGRRSGSECQYNGIAIATKEHAWEDRGEFIDELRAKLPPLIRERIADLKKKYAEKQAEFIEYLDYLGKKLDELKAAHVEYCNYGIPLEVKKQKNHAIRSLLREVIPIVIGFLLGIIWVIPWIISLFDDVDVPSLYTNLAVIGLMLFLSGKHVVEFIKAIRYANSKNFADGLADDWFCHNGFDEAESNIEKAKDEWDNISQSFERIINSAERALVGSDEALLKFYNKDKQTKNWYIEKIYEGAW